MDTTIHHGDFSGIQEIEIFAESRERVWLEGTKKEKD
jgi:hypothetical protein